jgi:hypothetical protein
MKSFTRREGLQIAAAGVATAVFAPAVRAGRKSGLGPVVVGSGAHTYECIHDWATLPADIAFGNTHGVAVDGAGQLHVKHTVHSGSAKPDAICVFDSSGKFVRSWGAEYRGGAHGLTLTKEPKGEFLYLSDCNRSVVKKTSLKGELALEFKWPEESGLYNSIGEYKPTNVAVVPFNAKHGAGDVYIADGYGKSWIHRYNSKGEYQSSFGGPGKERGQTSCPHGIAIDPRAGEPLVVVADRSNSRLQYFTLDGRHVCFHTGVLKSPCHFDFAGDVMLVPDLQARVTLFDRKNTLIAHLGDGENYALRDKPRDQFVAGKFIAPHSACFDTAGNIFVVEWVEVGRVTKLKKLG